MPPAFFDHSLVDGVEWFKPTEYCRGPWDANSCHAGPPSGLIARAVEQLVPHMQLVRLTVELLRPVPMAGFCVQAQMVSAGRQVSRTSAQLVDSEGRVCATALALHMVSLEHRDIPSAPARNPGGHLDGAVQGPFPIRMTLHGLPAINTSESMDTKYPEGEDHLPGPTTIWMRTIALLGDEEPSGFQRICVRADSGNAIGRNSEPDEFSFVNPDLTLVLHRQPVGEWLGSQAISDWHPDGIGLADALLFDVEGVVGRALQTLVVR